MGGRGQVWEKSGEEKIRMEKEMEKKGGRGERWGEDVGSQGDGGKAICARIRYY